MEPVLLSRALDDGPALEVPPIGMGTWSWGAPKWGWGTWEVRGEGLGRARAYSAWKSVSIDEPSVLKLRSSVRFSCATT